MANYVDIYLFEDFFLYPSWVFIAISPRAGESGVLGLHVLLSYSILKDYSRDFEQDSIFQQKGFLSQHGLAGGEP